MKKEQRPPYAINLRKARKAKGWNRYKTADLLGLPSSTYGSYEEARAKPPIELLPKFARILGITNMAAFLENPDFDYYNQGKDFEVVYQSDLESIYLNAPVREQGLVDMLLGIGVKKVTC